MVGPSNVGGTSPQAVFCLPTGFPYRGGSRKTQYLLDSWTVLLGYRLVSPPNPHFTRQERSLEEFGYPSYVWLLIVSLVVSGMASTCMPKMNQCSALNLAAAPAFGAGCSR